MSSSTCASPTSSGSHRFRCTARSRMSGAPWTRCVGRPSANRSAPDPTSRRPGRCPAVPTRPRAGGVLRPSRTSRAARAVARGRRAGRARTAAPRGRGAAPRDASPMAGSASASIERASAGRSTVILWRPNTSRSRSSSRGPQRRPARRARVALDGLEPREQVERCGCRVAAVRRRCRSRPGIAELGLVGDAPRRGRVKRDTARTRTPRRASTALTAAAGVEAASPTLAPSPM